MFLKVTLTASIVTFWSPTICDESRSYMVTVLEQIRHEITVEAGAENAARTIGLLEAHRTSGSAKPSWEPSSPSVSAHGRQADGFSVIAIEPAPTWPGTLSRPGAS